jgi:hypothetical protein
MKYTVTVNEAKKEIKVTLDGYEGIARCCPTDNFNLGTGIELALERAKVAKAEAEKPKVEAKPDMSVATAIKVLEKYVGGHIAIIGGGENMSEKQKAELRMYADRLAPTECPHCAEQYSKGYDKGYDEGYEDCLSECADDEDYDECEDEEDECECQCNSKCQCEGVVTGAMIKALIEMAMKG